MAGDSISTFPGNSVVLIESPNPDGDGYLQGSGVVIGPHTILTASHVVYDITEQTPVQNIKLYPGWDSADPAQGPGYIPSTYTDHFNEIGTFGSDDVTRAQSASDFAIIDTSYTFSSWMGVLLNYTGGVVTATGYPATAAASRLIRSARFRPTPHLQCSITKRYPLRRATAAGHYGSILMDRTTLRASFRQAAGRLN
jgi:V8-like Glu-specific endopeptidase